MKREVVLIRPGLNTSGCCPVHDDYPNSTFKNNRSKRARSRGKKIEHRYVRRFISQELRKENTL